jgi:hypothetical protein
METHNLRNKIHYLIKTNFNKHVPIDFFFHFEHETRLKEKLLNYVYKKSQPGQIISKL